MLQLTSFLHSPIRCTRSLPVYGFNGHLNGVKLRLHLVAAGSHGHAAGSPSSFPPPRPPTFITSLKINGCIDFLPSHSLHDCV